MLKGIFYRIENFFNSLLKYVGLRLVKISSLDKRDREKEIDNELFSVYLGKNILKQDNSTIECVIFSFDRPLQLHSLLQSFYENIDKPIKVHILYRTTDDNYLRAYEEVFEIFKNKNLNIVRQFDKHDFKSKLMGILESIKTRNMMFLVDDILFKNKLKHDDLIKFDARNFVLSLRMAPHLTRSYTNNAEQKIPQKVEDIISDTDKFCWNWEGAEHDWGYPISVDGNIFLTKEVITLSKYTEFNTPNTFEGNLQIGFKSLFQKKLGVCYIDSKLVNLPINKVNTDTENIFGNIDQHFLLEQWNKGYQMDYRKLYGVKNISAHQELPISFIKRKK